ncbi:hypothetical protein GGR57DRAFT_517252 [Xylariaceae sp. FL1272]|nr:hypothetical protein GGR57DRAFT_517252 [Xylariaceae sp. FL1272]
MHPTHGITAEVYRHELAADLDDDMVQDAMAIILFPAHRTDEAFKGPVCDLYMSWEARKLPNPLKLFDHENDDSPSIDMMRLHRLHSRLLLFIEDYLTKATAADPSRASSGLSPLFSNCQYLSYVGHPVSNRFSAAILTSPERQRLFRAFLRYELFCKMWCADKIDNARRRHELPSLWKYNGRDFLQVEAEGILSVKSYMESLHKAISIQCEYQNHFACFGGLYYTEISYFGFDLAAALIQAATSGKQGRSHVRMWYYDFHRRRNDSLVKGHFWNYKGCILGGYQFGERDKNYTEGPGMYRMLYDVGSSTSMLRLICRRKAWAFLDDMRLHPARTQQLSFTMVDWANSETLHDLHKLPYDADQGDAHKELEYPVPPFLQGNRFVGLQRFWE